MKKVYMKPTMQVVKIQQTMQILAGSSLDVPVYDDDEINDEGAVW